MRFTALDPPPPTPTTLMRVPPSISSWISNLGSNSDILSFLTSAPPSGPRDFSFSRKQAENARSAARFFSRLQTPRIHRQPRRRRPDRRHQFIRPIDDAPRKSQPRRTPQYLLRHLHHAFH